MNDYASLRKTKKTTRTIAVVMAILFIVEMCSLAMFFSRVIAYSSSALGYVISLTEGAAHTRLSKIDTAQTGFIIPTSVVDPDTLIEPEDVINDPAHDFGFVTRDVQQVWTTSTDIDFFHFQYDETGKLTVISNTNEKVFAPGTGDTYVFTLQNTGSESLNYLVYLEADIEAEDFAGNDLMIPLVARFRKGDGTFFVGDASDNWPDYEQLDRSGDLSSLSSGENANYFVDWQWPFERTDGDGLAANDAYDTMLGSLAALGANLQASIVIKTVAWQDETPEPTSPSESVATEATVAPSETTEPSEPTVAPSEPTVAPSEPTVAPSEPTVAPSEPTVAPTSAPQTQAPTVRPTSAPQTQAPTTKPTTAPATQPGPSGPTEQPASAQPTSPSVVPTTAGPTSATGPAQTDSTTPSPSETVTPGPSGETTVSPSETIVVIGSETPTSSSGQPKTGDTTHTIFWLILSIVVFIALIVLFVMYRRLKKLEKAAHRIDE